MPISASAVGRRRAAAGRPRAKRCRPRRRRSARPETRPRALPPCHGRSGGRDRRACAAMRTPDEVTSEAMTSSPVSASEPSIATEPVAQAAQPLRTSRKHGDARRWPAPRARQSSARPALFFAHGYSNPSVQPPSGAREQPAFVQAVGAGRSRIRSRSGTTPIARPNAAGAARRRPRSAPSPPRTAPRTSRGRRAGATGPRPRRRAANRARGWRNRRRPRPRLTALDRAFDRAPAGAATSSGTARLRAGLAASSSPLRLCSLV